jgi:hypothetical protein
MGLEGSAFEALERDFQEVLQVPFELIVFPIGNINKTKADFLSHSIFWSIFIWTLWFSDKLVSKCELVALYYAAFHACNGAAVINVG